MPALVGNRFGGKQLVAIVGLAFLWPCLQSSGFYPLTLVESIGDADPSVVARYHLLYSLELLVAFIVLAMLGRRLEHPLRSNRALPIIAGMCGIVGQCLLVFGVSGIARFELTPTLMVALPLVALFISVFVVLWGCRVAWDGFGHAVLGVSISFLLSQVVIALYCVTALPMGPLLCCCAAITSACAAVSAAEATSSHASTASRSASTPAAASAEPQAGSLRQLPWHIIGIVAALAWFCIVYVRLLIPSYTGDSSTTSKLFAALLCAGTYAVVTVYLARKPDADDRFMAVFIGLIGAYMLGLLVITLLSDLNGALSRRVLIASEHCLEAFLWMILCDAIVRKRVPSALVFALYGIAMVCLPWMVSFDMRYLAPIPEGALSNGLLVSLAAVALFVIAVCTVIFLFLHMRRVVQEMAQRTDSSRQQVVSSSMDGLGLTARELEVATLVYRGYSAKRIAETLYVSEPSVKNCTSRVYRKLGIHSKQELIAYIDGRQGDL